MSKNSLTGLCLFILFSSLGVAWVMSQPRWRPMIISTNKPAQVEIQDREHFIGNSALNAPIHDTFTLFNRGGKKLYLKNVRLSPGTSLRIPHGKTIRPGSYAEFILSGSTPKVLGDFSRWAILETSDPKALHITLVTKGVAVNK